MSSGRIAFLSTYVPRQCGIATFASDLCEAVSTEAPAADCFALAIDDRPEGYPYPPRVRFQFMQNDLLGYQRAADFLNISNADALCVQHEYGIFGGPSGSHVLSLLRSLRIPVVTTLHTILREPTPEQHKVLSKLIDVSDAVVSMSRTGVRFLREVYAAPAEKLQFIHHGIPDVPFVEPNYYKDRFDVLGRRVILTFGLLSPGKGIEYMIEALPRIIEDHPDVVYVVLGATHPHVLRESGEDYRLALQRRVRKLGLEKHVMFYNRFVELDELCQFIGAADVYVTPYLSEAQITSGTLAYALGAGKAVVSTPYWYAAELLDQERGALVPFRDPAAIAREVGRLLDDELFRLTVRKNAYRFGREMVWSEVARRYLELFELVRNRSAGRPRVPVAELVTPPGKIELPAVRLAHLHRMTDSTGMLQHAKFSIPDLVEGYTTDDNARALEVTMLAQKNVGQEIDVGDLAARYLAFLLYAFHDDTGRFRNFLSYDRNWLEDVGSEDSHGRSIMALGKAVAYAQDDNVRSLATSIFQRALPAVENFTSLRSLAFSLLGIHDYLRHFAGDTETRRVRETLAPKLLEFFPDPPPADWPWPEDTLTYANASVPHALLMSGRWMQKGCMVDVGLKALDWLMKLQTTDAGHFAPVGNNGFYTRGGRMARFDQQPIEAQTTVAACLEARRVTGRDLWLERAHVVFEWFLGRNDLGLTLAEFRSGGCHDGLLPDRVNRNRGAESTLAWLLALLEMYQADTEF
jgi:glycosyltransferase involved in cell wall biosynthesis